jgi:hypothetical protein
MCGPIPDDVRCCPLATGMECGIVLDGGADGGGVEVAKSGGQGWQRCCRRR